MAFFSLIFTAFSSVLYGVVITAVIMAILYVVLKSINDDIVHTIPFYTAGVILAILLVIQCSLMVGAIQAKGTIDAAHIYLNQVLEDYSGTVGAQDSQNVFDMVTEQFPLIGTFIGYTDFSGHEISDLPDVITNTINEFLTSFIWYRALWIVGMILTALIITFCFSKNKPKRSSYGSENYDEDFYLTDLE